MLAATIHPDDCCVIHSMSNANSCLTYVEVTVHLVYKSTLCFGR